MHKVGDIISGSISGIKPYGIFIKFDDITGFCHISNVSNKFIRDLNELYKIRDMVTAKIIEIDSEKQRLNVSIKDVSYKKRNRYHKAPVEYKKESEPKTFEDMLQKFIKDSDDKLGSMKRRERKKSGNHF